jgi:hypothetical protein
MEVKVDTIIFNYFYYTQNYSLSYIELSNIIDYLKKESNYAITVECHRDILNQIGSRQFEIFKFKETFIELKISEIGEKSDIVFGQIIVFKEIYDKLLPDYVKDLFIKYFTENGYIE